MADPEMINGQGMPENNWHDRPLVTFALFAFNQEKYIREAIEGAFAQSYSPLEIILSDDCSSDSTYDIMQEMAEAYRGSHRVVVERTPRNLGRTSFGRRVWSLLSQCNGELIVLAAGDDVSVSDRTVALFEEWNKGGRKAVCIHSEALPVDEIGRPIAPEFGNNILASLPLDDFIGQDGRGLLGATNAVSKDLLTRFGPFPDVLLIEDGALAFRARLADGILFVPRSLVHYRRHGENMTNQAELTSREALNRFVRGLIGQHTCFLNDYIAATSVIDRKLISVAVDRIKAAQKISYMIDGNFRQRIIASFYYSVRLPLKRRLWLFLNVIGLVRAKKKNAK